MKRSLHCHAVGPGGDGPAAIARVTESNGHAFASWMEWSWSWALGHNLTMAGGLAESRREGFRLGADDARRMRR